MTNQKFTDEQIIRCLNECYGKEYIVARIVDRGEEAFASLALIIDIINRQKAEIESLNAVHADMTESLRLAAEANKDMSAELKGMRGAANSYKMHYEEARSEAIKEFAEQIKAIFECDLCFDADVKGYIIKEIDDIAKEMTEVTPE